MSNEECPICLENIFEREESILSTDCGHLFCYKCLKKWQKNEPGEPPPHKCPCCRQNIPKVSINFTGITIEESSEEELEEELELEELEEESSEEPVITERPYSRLRSREDNCLEEYQCLFFSVGSIGGAALLYIIMSDIFQP